MAIIIYTLLLLSVAFLHHGILNEFRKINDEEIELRRIENKLIKELYKI